MEKNIMDIELTKEDLNELTPEELVDLKIKLEDMKMDLEELLQDDEDDEEV